MRRVPIITDVPEWPPYPYKCHQTLGYAHHPLLFPSISSCVQWCTVAARKSFSLMSSPIFKRKSCDVCQPLTTLDYKFSKLQSVNSCEHESILKAHSEADNYKECWKDSRGSAGNERNTWSCAAIGHAEMLQRFSGGHLDTLKWFGR